MPKELIIQCCKCTLVLTETELFKGLKPEILVEAIKKGKAYKRSKRVDNYENKNKVNQVNDSEPSFWLNT